MQTWTLNNAVDYTFKHGEPSHRLSIRRNSCGNIKSETHPVVGISSIELSGETLCGRAKQHASFIAARVNKINYNNQMVRVTKRAVEGSLGF